MVRFCKCDGTTESAISSIEPPSGSIESSRTLMMEVDQRDPLQFLSLNRMLRFLLEFQRQCATSGHARGEQRAMHKVRCCSLLLPRAHRQPTADSGRRAALSAWESVADGLAPSCTVGLGLFTLRRDAQLSHQSAPSQVAPLFGSTPTTLHVPVVAVTFPIFRYAVPSVPPTTLRLHGDLAKWKALEAGFWTSNHTGRSRAA